jgi:hypothetical protein
MNEERAIAAQEQGEWFKSHSQLEDEESFGVSTSGKHLEDFISDSKVTADDEDIYKEYQEMASRRSDRQTADSAADFKFNKDEMAPEMPTLEGYFDIKNQGVHPFDSVKNSFDQDEFGTQEGLVAEEEREAHLQQRELLGRLFGGEMNPRQYEMFTGMYKQEDLMTKRVRDAHNELFITNRDNIRLIEEHYEKTRRQKVLSGEWTEAESKKRL